MANAKTYREEDVPPKLSRAEWDFSSVPTSELIACLIWEYLRERPENFLRDRKTESLILQWTYENWNDRKKPNARYQNIPKSIIAVAGAARHGTSPPWQNLDRATRQVLAVPEKKEGHSSR